MSSIETTDVSIFTGALINGEHTLRDWGAAITNSDVVGLPEPSTVLIDIPGRSGRLDLTEALTGDVPYGNRELKLELVCRTDREKWVKTCTHVFNAVHGKPVRVIFDEDPGHYYAGRASVSEPARLANAGQMTVTVDAEPYRYEVEEFAASFTGGAGSINGTVENLRMPTIPTVAVPNACTLFHGGKSYSLEEGEQVPPGLVLHPGDNEFSVTGSQSITFRFRRGCL